MSEDTPLGAYRDHIVGARQKAQEDYDKTVLFLASGALAISLSFFDSVLGDRTPTHIGALLTAWVLWGLSLLAVLASYLFSIQALGKTIEQVDHDSTPPRQPGGAFASLTIGLNWAGGILLVAGVGFYVDFAFANLTSK